MIKSSISYIKKEINPRICEIIISAHFWIALIVAATYPLFGSRFEIKASEICSAMLAYSAIAVGFCLTSFTLALSISNAKYLYKLATLEEKCGTKIKNAYSDLLFVFSWTAIVHWVVIFCFTVILFVWPKDSMLYHYQFHWAKKAFVLVSIAQGTYSLFQFLITLITLSHVGRTYINFIKSNNPE